jgi:FkbM family methyltransferase
MAGLMFRIVNRLKKAWFAPKIAVTSGTNVVRLGSVYGGWSFEPSSDLHGSTIISAGFGEDATFDVEFASMFGAKVIIVDPTPRAIEHFRRMSLRLGQKSLQEYRKDGNQPVEAYDLSKVSSENFILEKSAIWKEKGVLKFFAPPDPSHVSYSIVNLQNEFVRTGNHIEVPANTISDILALHSISNVPLMKMDIEGAEFEVIQHMLSTGFRPRQILVEFDEMHFPSAGAKRRVEQTDAVLRNYGYTCRCFDFPSNFLYIQS